MATEKGHRRNSSRPKKENSDRWLLTYSDLITLLLAFFVIMYGMSSADVQKFSKLASSMRRAFNVDVMQGDPSPGILDSSTSLLSDTTGVGEGSGGDQQQQDLQLIAREMGWVLDQEGLSDKVTLGIRPEGTSISISGNLLFASGKSELRPDAVRLLDSLGTILRELPNGVRIEGHTDDIPPAGTGFSTNWELSSARAVAIVRYLSEMEEVDPARLSAVAYSQYRPVIPNDSPQDRGRNRRAEVLILYPNNAGNSQPSAIKENSVATH
jgi:chemotaxis protein MotB